MKNLKEDRQLVAEVQKGSNQAYKKLFQKYQPKLHTMLTRFVGDPHTAEDIVQESFIKAFRAIHSFRGDSAFYTWLYRIGVNTAKNEMVTKYKKLVTTDDFENLWGDTTQSSSFIEEANTPETELFSKQIVRALSEASDSLKPELSQAITMRELEGKSYSEIADIMNCPIGTVRSRIFRAREALAEKVRPFLSAEHAGRWH